jgi:alpha-tubulin suppressor-like RCC1 family protein
MKIKIIQVFVMLLHTALCLGGCGVAWAASLIAAGDEHALAVLSDGQVVSWGDNNTGQLGFGKTLYSTTPVEVTFPRPVKSVRVAYTHTLALDEEGNVWSWGTNRQGQLGDGTTEDRSTPAIVLTGATQIAASGTGTGTGVSLALDAYGQVWEWGGMNFDKTPKKVIGLTSVAGIYSSSNATKIAIDQAGKVWAWGDGQNGKHGNGKSYFYSSTPQQIVGLPPIIDIGIGRHVLAVDKTGSVWAWGNASGINGGAWGDYLKPTKLTGLPAMRKVGVNFENYGIGSDGKLYVWSGSEKNANVYRIYFPSKTFESLSVGDYHGLALDSTGTAWGWGSNKVGQIGSITTGEGQIELNGLSVKDVDASDYFLGEEGTSFFVTTSGKVFGLGSNQGLQFAISLTNDTTSRSSPSRIPSLNRVISVTARRRNSFAVTADGAVYGWGPCEFSQPSTCTPSSTPVKIDIPAKIQKVTFGGVSALGLDAQGKVWSWGSAFSNLGMSIISSTPGIISNPSSAIDIARGTHHGAVVAADGTVWTWGSNRYGELGIGSVDPDITRDTPQKVPNLSGIVQVAAGQGFTVARDQNGFVWAWGENNGGKFGFETPESTTITYWRVEPTPRKVPLPARATSVFTGENELCAVLNDGSARCYGLSFNGSSGRDFTFVSPILEVSIGSFSYGTTYFRLADGTIRAIGANKRGQIGDGTYVEKSTPVLVVNDTANGPLDLIPEVPNNISAKDMPPYWLQVTQTNEVATAITYNSEDLNKEGSVYITAYLDPASPLLAAPTASSTRPVNATTRMGDPAVAAVSTSAPVAAVLTRNGWKQANAATPTEPLYSGPLNPSKNTFAMYAASKFDNTKDRGLFCVAYAGASANSAKGLIRSVVSGVDASLNQCPPLQIGSTVDTQPPALPTGVKVSEVGGRVTLSWTASSDNVGVTSYYVYRGATLIAQLGNVTSYIDTSPDASMAVGYSVMACDIAQNCSQQTTNSRVSLSDCLFDWAERTYSHLFAPAGAPSATLPPYYYRYYPGTGNYLGVSSVDSHVWALGNMTSGNLLDLGPLNKYTGAAGCH